MMNEFWLLGARFKVVCCFNVPWFCLNFCLHFFIYIDVCCMNVCAGKWMLLQIDIWNVLYPYDATTLELFVVSSCTSYDLNLCSVFDCDYFYLFIISLGIQTYDVFISFTIFFIIFMILFFILLVIQKWTKNIVWT